MARDVYTIRMFAHASLSATTAGPIVPDQFVYVVRDIDITRNDEVGAQQLIVQNPLGGALFLVNGPASVGTINQQWRGRQVYEPGEHIGIICTGGSWSICISGYQLTLP